MPTGKITNTIYIAKVTNLETIEEMEQIGQET